MGIIIVDMVAPPTTSISGDPKCKPENETSKTNIKLQSEVCKPTSYHLQILKETNVMQHSPFSAANSHLTNKKYFPFYGTYSIYVLP